MFKIIKIASFFIFAIFGVLGLLFVNQSIAYAQVDYVEDEILVKYYNESRPSLIKIKKGLDRESVIQEFSQKKDVEYVEPNYIYKQSIIPSDTFYDQQWYFKKINALKAWDIKRESPDVVIAILDTGVKIDHPDLSSNIWRNVGEAINRIDDDKNGYVDDINGWDFVNSVSDPGPKFSDGFTAPGIMHGTIVAGIAAATGNNAEGITGVTWRAQIMSLKVLDDNGEGRTDRVVEALDYAIKNGADIVNLSFVGFGKSKSLEAAIERVHDAGIIILAAAGNEQGQGDGHFLDETPMYPVCHDGPRGENWVIGVAATDALDQKATFSSYGFRCVDISAPGVSIFSLSIYNPNEHIEGDYFDKKYQGYWAGTSMAVPMVSGAVALIKATNPALDRQGVYDVLLKHSDNISLLNQQYLGRLGGGRLNVGSSLYYSKALLLSKYAKIITTPQKNIPIALREFSLDGTLDDEFLAFSKESLTGASLTSCDLDGDGDGEIIVGAASGIPSVKIFKQDGELLKEFLAFDTNFLGGVQVACGDLNSDGFVEMVVGAGDGGGPHVRIFDADGQIRGHFFAYDPLFRGGVNVAVGDMTGDGAAEIITGAGINGGPHVRLFNGQGELLNHFFAFDKDFRHGVKVSVINTQGAVRNNRLRIVASQGFGGDPLVKMFNINGVLLKSFYAYSEDFKGGVSLAKGDINNDGFDEIITGAGFGGTPHVRIFESNGNYLGSFYAYDKDFNGGINVGVLFVNN